MIPKEKSYNHYIVIGDTITPFNNEKSKAFLKFEFKQDVFTYVFKIEILMIISSSYYLFLTNLLIFERDSIIVILDNGGYTKLIGIPKIFR